MITSLQHPLVKHWFLLRSDRAYREDAQRLLIVGEKMIRELADGVEIEALISLRPVSGVQAKEKHLVTDGIFKRITGLEHTDGFAAEIALPPPQSLSDFTSKKYVLVLDQVSDPGNLGTLLRTALALGWEGVILTNADQEGELRDVEAPRHVAPEAGDAETLPELGEPGGDTDRDDRGQRRQPRPVAPGSGERVLDH